jgi:purine catabolism regulator
MIRPVTQAAPYPAQHSAVFTIADALALPAVREGVPEVLAGEAQLTRPIRWVHSGEFPDMPAVLKGGELLLTHGMTLSRREDRQRRYVADLARAGLAGLVIEVGSGMKRIPATVVDEARKQDLPLIVLHRPIPWVEVTEAVHRTIVRRQDDLLERGQELHDRFAALVAAGAGVAEVLQALADSIANPVVLCRDGEIIYSAARGQERTAIASAWEAVERRLPHAPATVAVPIAVVGDPQWGVVAVLALEQPLDPFDRVALERAVPILALAFLRVHEVETLGARDRGEFLDALIDPAARPDDRQAHRRAGALGFGARSSWLLPLAADLAAGFGRLDDRRWALVGRDVRTELASRQTSAIVGTAGRDRQLAIVVGLSSLEQRSALAQVVTETVQRAVRRARTDAEAIVCAGRAGTSWSEAGDALAETLAALPAMRHAPPRQWHDVSGPDLRRLVWALRDAQPLVDFVDRRLAPLREHDARGRGELLRTLEVLCGHGGRKAETARALHLERQSLYKRLGRVEALLQADLDDEDTLLGLHLALRARRLLGWE